MRKVITSRRDAGRLLGPIFYEFCCRLYWCTTVEDPARDALLFMARGGLRLQFLFELFLKVNGLDCAITRHAFWISRFAAVKMTFQENPELAMTNLEKEFFHTNGKAMATALLPDDLYPDKARLLRTIPREILDAPVTREVVSSLYHHSCAYSVRLREHFQQQHDRGHRILRETFGGFRNLHTVDTGWFGSTLESLKTGCREWNWTSFLFGKWNYRSATPWYFGDITGLMIDAVGMKGKHDIDVFLEYHHIIEAPLEPEIPSVEYYSEDGSCNAMIPGWEKAVAGAETDDLWSGVKDYFASAPAMDLESCARATSKAVGEWKRLLRFPNREEARLLEVPPRSADFGKNEATPVFSEPDRTSRYTYWRSIKRSLWPAGMIAATSRPGRIRLKQIVWRIGSRLAHYRGAV